MAKGRYSKVSGGAEARLCTLLTISKFDQHVDFSSSIPIVEAKLRQNGKSYDVQFHHDYLRQDIASEPGFGIDSYRFVLKIFGSHGEAQRNKVLETIGIFGFTCKGMYYLVCGTESMRSSEAQQEEKDY
jgi:hypothetical protein